MIDSGQLWSVACINDLYSNAGGHIVVSTKYMEWLTDVICTLDGTGQFDFQQVFIIYRIHHTLTLTVT